jgi:RimK-like ATP-grasp domain
MPATTDRPLAVYYEHPDWFRPLFAELARRELPHVRLHAPDHVFDPGEPAPFALVFNRMSPSAYARGHGDAVFYTLAYLAYLERRGVRVVNGYRAFATETSKALQLALLERLGLAYPRARVIHHPAQAPRVAADLRFPVVVKPNIGGSGVGVRRFDTVGDLADAARTETLALGPDGTGLVQEFLPAADASIVRVEVLGGRFLYAIRIHAPGDSFNLCPADVCRRADGVELERSACPVDAPKNGMTVECESPPTEVIAEVERLMQAAGIEIGGVEYLIDARDGRRYYYDVNALSNFVADGPRVVGFDPVARLVDYLEREAA